MPSELAFTVPGSPNGSADALRSLRSWLLEADERVGRVELRHAEPQPGQLGSLTDALVVALGSGGAGTALASVLITWLRHRTTDLTIKVTRADGSSFEVSGQRLRRIDAPALGAEVQRLTGQLTGTGSAAVLPPGDGPADTGG